MYYKLSIYLKNKRFCKFKYIVDEYYLIDLLSKFNNVDKFGFIKVGTVLINVESIDYITYTEYNRKVKLDEKEASENYEDY